MQDPLLVLAILVLTIAISEWLSRHTFLRHLSSSLLVILLAAVWVNMGLIPSAADQFPLYSGIFNYVAPLSIFYLLLGVQLKHLRRAGLPMLIMFLIGSLSTAIGAIVAIKLVDGAQVFGDNHRALAGMMTGTYTGGSVNFNAIALHYKMNEQVNIYAGTVAVDNIITALWMMLSLLLPKLLQRWLPRNGGEQQAEVNATTIAELQDDSETIDPMQLGWLIALGVATLWGSNFLADLLAAKGINVPSILILTTIALIFAQFRVVQHLNGSKLLGLFLIYLFLAVIGALCELAALGEIGELVGVLVIFTSTIVLVHGLLIYLIGGIFKQDWALISIASQANIGGPSTAIALARSFGKTDLILSSILVGSLGAGLGTYLGFFIAEVVL